MQATEKIWMNGELVDWDDAKIHVGAHGLHYGTGVFEGIRCYDTPQGTGRLPARATTSIGCTTPRGCSTWSCRIRSTSCATSAMERNLRQRPPVVLPPTDRVLRLRGAGRPGTRQPGRGRDHELAVGDVSRRRWPAERHPRRRSHPGSASARTLFRTSRRRPASTSTRCSPSRRRSTPATTRRSCSPHDGYVADGSGENIFVVKDGVIYTPDLSAGILPGITRDTVIQIAQDLGYTVVEKNLIRSDLLPRRRGASCAAPPPR